jgi:hypothetical protein
MVDLDDLVSARILTARLGYHRIQDIHQARARQGFPEPVKMLSRTALWLWTDARRWALEHGWKPYRHGSPIGSRVFVEPHQLVPVDVVIARLDLDPDLDLDLGDHYDTDTDGDGGVEGGAVLTRGMYRWSRAEAIWHERANLARPRTKPSLTRT